MPLLDAFSEQIHPDELRKLREMQAELQQRSLEYEDVGRYLEAGIDGWTAEYVAASSTPPGGVFGVGIWDLFESPRPAFFVIAHPETQEPYFEGEANDSWIASGLIRLRLGYVPVGFAAVGLPPTQPHRAVSPGDPVSCQGNSGALGIGVWTKSGTRGITTAGHVAEVARAQVIYDNRPIGLVGETDQPNKNAPGTDCADLAVVTLDDGVDEAPLDAAVARGGQLQDVRSLAAPGLTGFIRGVADSWAYQTTSGSWGDVLITDRAISQPGHSGAPCIDGQGNVVGHIVAGAIPAYSVLQDVNYQLGRMGLRPRFTYRVGT